MEQEQEGAWISVRNNSLASCPESVVGYPESCTVPIGPGGLGSSDALRAGVGKNMALTPDLACQGILSSPRQIFQLYPA